MLKSDYQFKDSEVRDFYYHVAMKKPQDRNRGGSEVRFLNSASFVDVEKANDRLDILYYYEREFVAHGMWKQSRIIGKVRSKVFEAVFNWNRDMLDEITIPNEEHGKSLVCGELSRDMRMMCNAFDSVLNGKPNELARAMFA